MYKDKDRNILLVGYENEKPNLFLLKMKDCDKFQNLTYIIKNAKSKPQIFDKFMNEIIYKNNSEISNVLTQKINEYFMENNIDKQITDISSIQEEIDEYER